MCSQPRSGQLLAITSVCVSVCVCHQRVEMNARCSSLQKEEEKNGAK